jgi:hypothetical protein
LARLLLPEMFEKLELKGEPVVVGASREVVFVAGSQEPEALELMARWIPEYLDKHPFPIAFAPMVLRNGGWSPYRPSSDLPAAAALELLQTAHDYEQQTPMMLQRLERTGRSPETSPMKLLQTDAGPVTIAFWRATTSLIPKVDFVVVQAVDQQLVRDWSNAREALGLVEEPDTASHHYFASRTPDANIMAALAATPEPEWAQGRGFSISGGRLTVFG